ncbi:hypothetical protein B7494_g8080 [Chlorociboria aeruginascens]|nr:hypothetical protein B7494_g8080 [Chlorociboria aeruginascens]
MSSIDNVTASSSSPSILRDQRMTRIQKALESIILNPKYAPILAVLKSARNGAVYGAKVRFPHALVYILPFHILPIKLPPITNVPSNSMIFLFRSGTIREKLALIFRATRTHAQNLAKYATVYKLTMLVLKHMGSTPGKEGTYDTFLAGLLGGYLVFGRRSPRGHISSYLHASDLGFRDVALQMVSGYGADGIAE